MYLQDILYALSKKTGDGWTPARGQIPKMSQFTIIARQGRNIF